MRLIPAAVAAALLLPAHGAVYAAPASVSCWLVADPNGDATGLLPGVPSPKSFDSMDITGLAIATDANRLTSVIRAYSLYETAVESPTGRLFTYTFKVRGTAHTIKVLLKPDGTTQTLPADATPVVVDEQKSELRTTVTLAAFKLNGLTTKEKDKFVELSATTQRWVGDLVGGMPVPDEKTYVDEARGSIRFLHRSRSCVTVGK